MSFDPIRNFFMPVASAESMTDVISQFKGKLDLSYAVQESWKELFIDIKGFKDVPYEKILEYKSQSPKDFIKSI